MACTAETARQRCLEHREAGLTEQVARDLDEPEAKIVFAEQTAEMIPEEPFVLTPTPRAGRPSR
jgi:hypothetical protein